MHVFGASGATIYRASVLEDDPLLCLDLEERLRLFGIEARSFQSEDHFAGALEPSPHVAIINLAFDRPSRMELAALLRARGIGVILCSGTPSTLPGLPDVPFLSKPFDDEALGRALAEVIAPAP